MSMPNPFPPLQLSPETKQQLIDLATLFVDEAMGRYEAYMFQDQRQVNPSQWKLQRELEDVRVYRQRRSYAKRAAAMGDNSTQSPAAAKLPVVLTVGTLQVDLYDLMYGVVSPTTDDARIKSSYTEDDVASTALLETLAEPSHAEPFRSLTVRWSAKGVPLLLRSIVKSRDFVYLDSIGLARLPTTGELVGYQLIHSVTFPTTPPLDSALRGNISICTLYRQHADGVVDAYSKGFLDLSGRLLKTIDDMAAVEVMISLGRYVILAQQKKLTYAMRRREHFNQVHNPHKHHNQGSSAFHDKCIVCSKPFSKMGGSSQCHLCLQLVCGACCVERKLSAISPIDSSLHQQRIPFCLPCVTAVANASALDMAHDDVASKDAVRSNRGSMRFSLNDQNRVGRGTRAG